MIRPFTCLCMVLAGASGLYLYQAKHRVQLLDREIAGTFHATEAARERIGVLRAEWTLQNDPERLAQLADRFLTLKTLTPGQFTNMAELDRRLPAVRAPEAKPPEMDETAPVAGVQEPETTKLVAVPDAKPEAPPHKEAVAAAPHQSSQAAPLKVATAAPHPPEHRAVPSRETAAAVYQPPHLAVAETRSIIARAASGLPRPVSPLAASYAPATPAPVVTSVLGIARTSIAPPVPYLAQTISNGGG